MASSKRLLHSEKKRGLAASPGAAPSIPTNPESVIVTEAAAAEIKSQAETRGTPNAAIRVGLRGGGCSGFTYTFDWDDSDPREKDHVLTDHGVRVFIDHRSMKLLKGTILDYHKSLMSRGFKFHNPNATGTCGCGESVSF
jgi:iron-sulfur cluster assembly protein